MGKITFDTEELGKKIIRSIGIHNAIDGVIPSDVVWDCILEELYDFEYVIYDEVESQLNEQDIEIMKW